MEADLAVRTLFAEFQEAVFRRFELERRRGDETVFVSKTLKGRKYWYRQKYVGGRAVQKYHFPSTPGNDRIVLHLREEQRQRKVLLRKLSADEQNRAAMLKRGGLPALDAFTAAVMKPLSGARLVYQGGMLVGTYAFRAYSGMLGVCLEGETLKTQDIDIACDPLAAMPFSNPLSILRLLRSVDGRFREVPSLSPKYPAQSYVGPHGLRVALLAPLRGKHRSAVRIRGLVDAAAQPVRFLHFLMKNAAVSVLIGPRGGIPVTVPHPARYAVHKLLVAARRPVAESSKRAKDILQAAGLLPVCMKEEPAELKKALLETIGEGKKWKRYLLAGMQHLPPDIQREAVSLLRP